MHKKAEQGDVVAQYDLGSFFFGKENDIQGMFWTIKAAEQGHVSSQLTLAGRYQAAAEFGGAITEEAIFWFCKAADQDESTALNWYEKSRENNLLEKCFITQVENVIMELKSAGFSTSNESK